MDFSRGTYPAMLDSLQPTQAANTLNERVKRVGLINTQIADWLQERRKVEEAYVAGLKKLVRKQPPDESSELGVFSMPWARIVNSAESIAQSHHILAQKIEVDVEQPLREYFGKDREIQALSTMQGNLTAMAKEVDAATDKADKLKKKGGKAPAGKVASATSEVESANSQWASQAPFVFEKLQAIDESRLNHLRDVLTQFQTHEVDQVERDRDTAEKTLNALLTVETADEIQTFAARTVGGRPRLERQRSRTNPSGGLTPATTSQNIDDSASQRSGVSEGASKSNIPQESRHSGFSGLKRLGTVISRRRQSTVPYGRNPSPNKHSTDRFSGFGRSSKEAPPLPSPRTSNINIAASSSRDDRPPSQAPELPPLPIESHGRADELPNGSKLDPESNRSLAVPNINGQSFGEMQQIPSIPIAAPIPMAQEQRRDPEGFSIPPAATDPISQAEQEASLGENQQPQFKLDIRNDPIQEEDADAETALANVANTLRAQAAPNRKAGTVRGRRDVRNTIFVPSPQTPDMNTSEPSSAISPFKASRAATLSSEDHGGSDTQSVRSSHSLSTISSAIVRHPDLHEPGLNSSVVETVSTWFEHGQVIKAVVIGELALAYNPVQFSAQPSESIRLENFPALEKVAPNPTFLSQNLDRSGEYTVDFAHLNKTAVAFKYQLHLEESNLAVHAPITLAPSWKVETNQASVILSYSFNPLFAPSTKRNIKLHDVTILIHLEGAKASSCQSKPVGTFSKEKSLIFWRLGDITLTADGAPTKLLARFVTEVEAKPGPVEVRWEITGEEAVGLGSGLNVSQMAPKSAAAPGVAEGADPFADERAVPSPSLAWKEVSSVRRLVSGKYTAI